MEGRMGHSFADVRVHHDASAAQSAGAIDARAYTLGSHVVFAAGAYRPRTAGGRRLLAHELTHVVQQEGSGEPGPTLTLGSVDDPAEGEAASGELAWSDRPATSTQAHPTTGPAAGGAVIRRQDAGTPDAGLPDAATAVDVGGAAATGGAAGAGAASVVGGGAAGGAAPAAGAAAPALGDLRAVRERFKASGTFDPANCATARPTALGVGVGGNAINGMELTYRLEGTIPAGTDFDITRTVTDTEWERDAGGAWHRLFHTPAGTGDDRHNADECLRPSPTHRIFVTDGPGLHGLDPTGAAVAPGVAVAATATAFVVKLSFAEWVIARNRSLGVGWTRISDPTFTFWHSITSVALSGGAWALANTPSGQANQIGLGSTSVAGATP
jgi:hypothetical protein